MLKLHIGCGEVYLKGWVNIDIDSKKADLVHDLRKSLPFKENSVDFIFNEHFIEHITAKEGVDLIMECRRVLKPGGVVRTATPDLDYIVFRYFFFWKRQPWFKKYGYDWIKTRAEYLNICFYEWGHRHLYNEEELNRRLREAGFEKYYRRKLYASPYKELKNLETRKESDLIVEAIK